MKNRVYFVLLLLTGLVPFGLLSDAPAWGEWEKEYYQKILGFIPKGIKNAKDIDTPLKEYSFGALSDAGGYYLSALIGVVLIFIIFYILAKVFNAKSA